MKLKILGLDDDPYMHNAHYRPFFTDPANGWDYFEARNPKQASEILNKESIDVIILDNSMGGEGDGLNFLGSLRRDELGLSKYKEIPVVMISSDAVQEYAFQSGATGYIDKYSYLLDDEVCNSLILALRKYEKTKDKKDLKLFY